jgi:signal transduction histidine kinase
MSLSVCQAIRKGRSYLRRGIILKKKSLTREIHQVQLISIFVFGLFFIVISLLIYWDRNLSFQKERALTLNRLLASELTEQNVITKLIFYQNNGKTPELRQLLRPLIQKTVYAFPNGYLAGYYSVPLEQIIIGFSRTQTENMNGTKLPAKDPGRKIWITKQHFFSNSWSKIDKTWVLKCYYPIIYKEEVIGHTFCNVPLFELKPLLRSRLMNILALLSVGMIIAFLAGKKATLKINKNIHRLTLVEPGKKFPPFDYKEFDKVAATNHKIFEDLLITGKARTELLTNFPWGFCIINSDGILTNINNKGLDLLGLSREGVLRRGISALGREFTAVLRAFHENIPIETEVVLNLKEDEKKVLLVNAFPVTLDSGESGAMACFIDITGQRRMQMMIEHMNRLSTVGEMISIIVHDIRNPLATIKGLAQLSYMKQESNFRLNCKKIDKTADEINSYLEKILTFSQPADDQLVNCSIREMFENVLVLLQGKLNRSQVVVEAAFTEPEPYVNVSRLDFQYVLYTFLNNVTEMMNEPGKIGFKVDYWNEMVRVAISESGCFLPARELSKIWETVYTSKPVGINVGLAMSKRLIQKYEGDVIVTSEEGRGTIFTIVLPTVKTEYQTPVHSAL